MPNRRQLLYALAGMAGVLPRLSLAGSVAAASSDAIRIGATWRGLRDDSTHCAGMLQFDAASGIRILWSQQLPGRAHGLVTGDDGSLLVMAVRPGYWMRRFAPDGGLQQSLDLPADGHRHFTGHAVASRDSLHLLTGETDLRDDSGWISVRDCRSLRTVAQWPTHGIEPHDLKLDASGALVVANGGIRRAPGDRKRELDRMASSITRLDTSSGALLGQWQLQDPRLSLRHMAWSHAVDGKPLLGIGIQAEHDSPARRGEAPVLATWDGASLSVPTFATAAAGYAGDICAAPQGGFILSSNRVNSALWWHPAAPGKLTLIARLTEAYALSRDTRPDAGVLISSARGAALWHPTHAAAMLPWPEAMVMENHWAVMPG
jgi:uncharacterized protein